MVSLKKQLKEKKALFEDRSDTILDLLHSKVLENFHFHVSLFLVTAADGYLGLPNRIILIEHHLQICLIEFD